MRRFFLPASIGGPQLAAAALLGVYLLQCLWLVRIRTLHISGPDSDQAVRIQMGLQQWKHGTVAGTPESIPSETATGEPSAARSGQLRVRDRYDQDRSPFYYLIAAAPFLIRPASWTTGLPFWHVLAVAPYLFFGVMLGGSLWYVARRLYGNAGGYIALLLYCFSPAMIAGVAGMQSLGEMGAVWGAFGAIWTAIAVAHTLYAPREVVLWNWRRIFLLGLSLALAAGNQFSLGVLAPVALLLMLWVAPVRKGAVVVIWGAACGVALVILFAAYFFHQSLFWQGMIHARWLDFEPRALAASVAYRHNLEAIFRGSPSLILTLPVALVVFASWKRARYFGNIAPLGIALILIVLAVAAPGFPGEGFQLTALVFLFVFIAGVFADLLETRRGLLVMSALCGLLIASAAWNLVALARAAGQ
ncbi:MAG TPA: hypothetical protein VK657_08605 [Terriglobales bacterium]|jgi:hypothetical protein|nr:hypothetical protein [Terriglobales bacterium]